MSFHPGKCIALRTTLEKSVLMYDYHIRGQKLTAVESARYLGVNSNNKLSRAKHVSAITAGAGHSLLRRNISQCPKAIKVLSYKALVRPKLEYCSSVWDPHHTNHTRKVEAIQRRATYFTCGDYRRESSVTAMLKGLGWRSLSARRKATKAVMIYK